MANDKHIPPVLWAQRNDKIYITLNVEDCKNPVIKLEDNKLFFSGKAGPDGAEYENTIEFFKEINPAESKYVVLARHIPMVIMKKEDGPYWPRLLSSKTKVHWLKTDFSKWKDEDDSDTEEKGDNQFSDMMSQMGNFNTGGGGDMPEHEADDEDDSDDEELPDLQS